MTLGSTCKHCAHFRQGSWCDEWERSVHPNTVQCGRFLALTGEQPEERPFRPMFSVTITPDSESAAYGGGPTMAKRQRIPDEHFDEALRLREQEDMSPADIAAKLGITPNRVRYMLDVARRRRGGVGAAAPDDPEEPKAAAEEMPTSDATPEKQADAEEPPPPSPATPGPDVRELMRSLNALGRIVERLDGRVEKAEGMNERARDCIDAVAHATARELQVIRESVELLRRDLEQQRHEFMRHGHLPSGDVALPILGRETA